MPWIIILLGYFIGSIPTAHIIGHMKGVDIRHAGDKNVGAANAYRLLGAKTGILVGLIDAGKGALAVLVARSAGIHELAVMSAGAAAVIGHNFPVYIGFRGGRGAATTIGVFLVMLTQPMLILAVPSLLTLIVTRSTTIANAVLFIPLSPVSWWLGVPALLIGYSIALPCLVGLTHLLRTRRKAEHPA